MPILRLTVTAIGDVRLAAAASTIARAATSGWTS